MKRHKTTPIAILLALCLGTTAPAFGQSGDLDAKRSEAARLEAQIESQGERLSMAQEDYNYASDERRRLEAKLDEVRSDLQAAEDRWTELKALLGQRVRNLYKRPGFWAEQLLSARSLGELARGRVLAGSVMMADNDLIFETDKARHEMMVVATQVDDLREAAIQKEQQLADFRVSVERELRTQRTLLGQVEGDIAQILEEQRRRELEEARRRAAEEARRRAAEEARRAQQPPRAAEAAPAAKPAENLPPVHAPRPQAAKAIEAARSQMGTPYCWGGTGPDCYDCSGLTQWAWAQAGVSIPRSSRQQYAGLPKVPRDQIQPGDLLFFGNPIHHVGLYEGDGIMIEAPQSGEQVRRRSIHRSDYAGAARP